MCAEKSCLNEFETVGSINRSLINMSLINMSLIDEEK